MAPRSGAPGASVALPPHPLFDRRLGELELALRLPDLTPFLLRRARPLGGVLRDRTALVRPRPGLPAALPVPDAPPAPADTSEELSLALDARLESKAERTRDETCSSDWRFNLPSTCRSFFQPNFDFQFSVRSAGTVADRFRVDVDYDSQREFDASNQIAIRYEGKPEHALQRVEVGNVTFTPPVSRFITAGIPMGNYGVQATGRVGPWSISAIAAQQRGNVVQERRFSVGGQTLQQVGREIEDYELEARRFFFTVDPAAFGDLYPNLDILDPQQLAAARRRLAPEQRPERVFVYRLIIGGRPPNPNGPRFRLNGIPTSRSGPAYELLRENVDYYMDPSRLWLALVRPLGLYDERLVVAYTVRVNGEETVVPEIGGTPDVEFVAGREQVANLVWEPRLEPDAPAFRREIRSVYRVGGPDVQRQTVTVRVASGAGGDQEKPLDGIGDSYLQRFGLAERTNSAAFDVDNRLWPRRADPNVVIGGGEVAPIIRDQFLVFPSLEPFSRRGLAGNRGNPVNDTLYRIPGEYLYSAQHPPSAYQLTVNYLTTGGDPGTIALGSVQVRGESERVTLNGQLLRRGVDYEVDYDLGQLRFLRQSLIAGGPHDVRVRFEENPLFVAVPTTVYGLTSQITLPDGHLAFTAIAQRQKTVFTRPELGFEPVASLVAGVSGAYAWDAAPLTRLVSRLPGVDASVPSRVTLSGEFATSRPLEVNGGQAYLESFEGAGGVLPPLAEGRWYFGSDPAPSPALQAAVGPALFVPERAATLAWQNVGRNRNGELVTYSIEEIDPGARGAGGGVFLPEQMLWLTLHPLADGGFFPNGNIDAAPAWQVANAPAGRRWRSLHTALGPTGADLSRVEAIEFWTLVDLNPARLAENPLLVFDLGELSENSFTFAPETLRVVAGLDGQVDTTFRGKRVQGRDSLDTELDPFSRTFNQARDDVGLPGDVADRATVLGPGTAGDTTDAPLCARGLEQVFRLGDPRANCTVANNRADTEDLDNDAVLNLTSAQLGSERLRRYIVDLADPELRARIGRCNVVVDAGTSGASLRPRCWVQYRIPFRAPSDSLNGGPPLRRVQALRVTVVSGAQTPDGARVQLPLTRLRFIGAPWLKRSERSVVGIAGERPGQGIVTATTIGTQDRDSLAGLFYESPPGVTDEPEQRESGLEATRQQVNERSLRLQATQLAPFERAEAYVRFPEGEKSFLGYRELRVWARGRNSGWGHAGELQFYVKAGRDADNFYMYRTPVNAGVGRNAWEPEVRVDLRRFSQLRARLQRLYLEQPGGAIACAGTDSLLVANSPTPAGGATGRFAVCEDGYIVHTVNPAVSPPNLNAVQELAVGMVRLSDGGGTTPVLPGDTLELWVNDLRLGGVENSAGYAGQLALSVNAGDVAELSLAVTRRDPYFRQLTELPGFRTDDAIEAAATVRLDRFLPQLGVALPVTVRTTFNNVDPLFVSNADYDAAGIPGLRTPRATVTTVSASLRRAEPLQGSAWAPLVNNLALSASFTDASSRSEYQSGRAHDVSTAVEYRVAAQPRMLRLPGWLGGAVTQLPSWLERATGLGALRDGEVRWNPSEIRLSTGMARTTDRRLTFLQNARSSFDDGRAVTGENYVWRNVGSLALQPVEGLSARLELSSVRDLRDYGDSSVAGFTATRARHSLFGADVGFERERLMTATLSYRPDRSSWFTPRVEVTSRFDLLRDPDRLPLLLADTVSDPLLLGRGEGAAVPLAGARLAAAAVDGAARGNPFAALEAVPASFDPWAIDSLTGEPVAERLRMPRRLGGERTVTTGAQLDVSRLLVGHGDGSALSRWLATVVQPLDVTYVRSLRSAYDALPFTPDFGFQLGLGGTGDFRQLRGLPANSAGLGTQLSATQSFVLPRGLSVVTRYTRSQARNWTGQLLESDADGQRVDEGAQTSFPDVQLRWSWRPGTPRPGAWIADASASARLLHTQQRNVALADAGPGLRESRTTRVRSYPASGSITWNLGRLTTAGGYALTLRTDTIPGTRLELVTRDASGEIARPFTLPASWGLPGDLRTRASYQYTRSYSTAASLDDATRNSRLVDNGRWAVNLNAETDVAENLTFVLQGARIVTFDENLNRRVAQTVLTAALQLSFFAGPLTP